MRKLVAQYRRELVLLARYRPAPPAMLELASRVARKHGISLAELRGRYGRRKNTPARGEFARAAAHDLGKPPIEIARFLGNRDHSTICYYLRGQR